MYMTNEKIDIMALRSLLKNEKNMFRDNFLTCKHLNRIKSS